MATSGARSHRQSTRSSEDRARLVRDAEEELAKAQSLYERGMRTTLRRKPDLSPSTTKLLDTYKETSFLGKLMLGMCTFGMAELITAACTHDVVEVPDDDPAASLRNIERLKRRLADLRQ